MSRLLFFFFGVFCVNLVAAQPKPIEIFYEKSDDGFVFYGRNIEEVPYTVKINFDKLNNLADDSGAKSFTRVIPPNTFDLKVLELKMVNQNKGTSFDFNFIYTIGDASLPIEEDHPYLLPFKHGKRVRVGQGNNGSGTHRGINAIDFNLDVGDSIYAARDGLVIEIKEDSDTGGNAPKFEPYGNFIKVYHEDGTIGSYVHLVQKGSFVKKGDKIKEGQLIGISGNTGWSSGPHLHFMVSYNRNFKNFTLPVKFLNYDGQLFIPIESKSYYSYHPGKPKYQVEDRFQESKFEGKMEPSDLNDKIEFSKEDYGDYTLIYVNNGKDRQISGLLKIELQNMIPTKKLPFTFTVPAKTKMYLIALSPDDGGSYFGYQLSAEFR